MQNQGSVKFSAWTKSAQDLDVDKEMLQQITNWNHEPKKRREECIEQLGGMVAPNNDVK